MESYSYINEEEEQHRAYAMQLANSAALPMVLRAVIQLDVFEIIARAGPEAQLSPAQIAVHLPTKNPDAPAMLDRMLRLLVGYRVLTCSVVDGGDEDGVQRVYGLAPVAKYFYGNDDGASLGPLLDLVLDKVYIHTWYELKNAVLEGGVPFDKVHGVHAFEYQGRDPEFNHTFNKAMLSHTTIVMNKILECYKGFDHISTLVDVAGGIGATISMITSKYPNIKGINFDLPHVIKDAPSYPGVEHIGGDMFEHIPKGDAIFMKWVLHNWSDKYCLKLLKNCYDSLPKNGKVIVVGAVIPVRPDTNTSNVNGSQLDLVMMAQTTGGKERTENELLALATGAGFSGVRSEYSVWNMWVMEFYK